MLAKGQERVLCVCVAKVWSKTHGFVLGFEDLLFFFFLLNIPLLQWFSLLADHQAASSPGNPVARRVPSTL